MAICAKNKCMYMLNFMTENTQNKEAQTPTLKKMKCTLKKHVCSKVKTYVYVAIHFLRLIKARYERKHHSTFPLKNLSIHIFNH